MTAEYRASRTFRDDGVPAGWIVTCVTSEGVYVLRAIGARDEVLDVVFKLLDHHAYRRHVMINRKVPASHGESLRWMMEGERYAVWLLDDDVPAPRLGACEIP